MENMEFSIRRVARQSTVSGVAFVEGEEVACILYRSAEGLLERADLREVERAEWSEPGPVLCRWRHRFKPAADSDSERTSLATAEEIFLGLLEELGASESEACSEAKRERLVLLNLTALMLERRRILKPLGSRKGHYRYMPEKRDLTVPFIELDPREICGLLSEIDALL